VEVKRNRSFASLEPHLPRGEIHALRVLDIDCLRKQNDLIKRMADSKPNLSELRVSRKGMGLSHKIKKFTVVLLLAVVGSSATGVLSAQPENQERIDRRLASELNSLETSMGAIYQAMYAMLRQASEQKKDKMQEMKVASEQKLRAALEACHVKSQEIEDQRQSAEDAWSTAIISCADVASGVASIRASVLAYYHASDKRRLQRISTDGDALKKRLAKLIVDLNLLHKTLKSGKIDGGGKDRLEKMKAQLENSLRQLRDTKTFVADKAEKKRSG
jgi:hypothetical protein